MTYQRDIPVIKLYLDDLPKGHYRYKATSRWLTKGSLLFTNCTSFIVSSSLSVVLDINVPSSGSYSFDAMLSCEYRRACYRRNLEIRPFGFLPPKDLFCFSMDIEGIKVIKETHSAYRRYLEICFCVFILSIDILVLSCLGSVVFLFQKTFIFFQSLDSGRIEVIPERIVHAN